MTDIVNLNRARKKKARQAEKEKAQAMRILHGLPKPQRELAKARAEMERLRLDAHKKD